ncbi:replication factor c subunit 5 [Stylonychia lemnae]|uniref:Replication factor c subunit 5 n=1 Tax=Stylonychia lemnae TaxID=5949 RepID=A0A078B2I7_STYLE|nr:replication factor c subunit 5 [Stylonychia lemnae]|eukprot:CDW88699.1 replication factor c subunit 5 [Stylonychia lemnae]
MNVDKTANYQQDSNDQRLPFVEKYRPNDLQSIISHDEIIKTIQKFISTKTMPHLLFHGPPGTGKTSCIIAIAKHLYGPQQYKNMILELNASDDRGIQVVREQIKSFCSTQQLMSKGIKLVILDECDSMTSSAQFALRRIVEKFTKTTRFCFICNYVSKIIPALQSRCTRFRFGPLDSTHILRRLNEIAMLEQLELEPKAAQAIVYLSAGDMRKVLNILESCALAHQKITTQNVYDVTGRPSPDDITSIYKSLNEDRLNKAIETIYQIKQNKSLALEDILSDLHKAVMKTKYTDQMKIFLISRMADIEYRLAYGSNEKINTSSLVGAFVEIRSIK